MKAVTLPFQSLWKTQWLWEAERTLAGVRPAKPPRPVSLLWGHCHAALHILKHLATVCWQSPPSKANTECRLFGDGCVYFTEKCQFACSSLVVGDKDGIVQTDKKNNNIPSYILKENRGLIHGNGWQVTFKWESVIFQVGFSCGLAGKESACNARDLGSIPGLGRSPGEGKGYPLQYSGLENSMGSQRVGHD